jgi:5-methyltetrahydrofolate--homocysteine methyltransferase
MDIREAIKHKILVLDGAMGTMLQQEGLKEDDYRGERFHDHPVSLRGMSDVLCLTRPNLVKNIHRQYLEAGADIITTNSFNANILGLDPYRLKDHGYEINRQSALLARESIREFIAEGSLRSCFVAGTMGPTDKMASLSPRVEDPGYRSVDFDTLAAAYARQARGLIDGGVDLLLIETVFDTLNAKAAFYGIQQSMSEAGREVPVMVSGTISGESGRSLSGQTVEAFYNSLQPYHPFAVGLNCSFGPDKLIPFLERLSEKAVIPVSAHPNAGLPNELGEYDATPDTMATSIEGYFKRSLVNIIGGCCGSTPEHVRVIAGLAHQYAPRRIEPHKPSTKISGLQSLSVKEKTRMIKVGERTNVTGSRKMARLIHEGQYEEALNIARQQIDAGADILNISVDEPMIDAGKVLPEFLKRLAAEPDVAMVPLMIDSSHFEAIEKGLKVLQGKSIVNSISLKDGKEDFVNKARTLRQLGAAVVVMAFDERGQAVDYKRKTEICQRAYRILTGELNFPPEDIIFDPNVMAVGTGVEEHTNYALDFLDTVRWIRKNLPHARVNAGISNVSFAFRANPLLREYVNSAFLHHCEKAGLDFAIVNPARIYPYQKIPEKLRKRIDDLLFNRKSDATERLIEAATGYDQKAGHRETKEKWREQSPQKRLQYALRNGITRYLEEDLEEARTRMRPALNIIEGPLMEEMKAVGDRFGKGRMFLPQVIKSARVMNEAVSYLMPSIQEETETEKLTRGKILLATVEGDVHDIGKNILSMVLQCNHFEVIDMGVMVPASQITEKIRAEKPDILGLSGLITPSLDKMMEVVKRLEKEGFDIPVMVGGATTSQLHTAVKLAPHYSGTVVQVSDVTKSVGVASDLMGEEAQAFCRQTSLRQEETRKAYIRRKKARRFLPLGDARKNRFHYNYEEDAVEVIPRLLGTKTFIDFDLKILRNYIDWTPFFHGWGLKGVFPHILEKEKVGREANRLFNEAQDMLDEIVEKKLLRPKGVIGIFPANSEGDDILIFTDDRRKHVRQRIPMLRQQQLRDQKGYSFSLSDFIAPVDSGIRDYFGGFAVTSGFETEKHVRHFKEEGDSYNSVMVRLIADRLVEAFAEVLHERVRKKYWGYEPDEELSKEELIKEKYKGIRPAPGYPACPDHTLKGHLFDLLRVEERIGISLTGSYAMNPASSVAGFYIAHDLSKYFGIGKIGSDQLEDYARRAQIDLNAAQKWLSPVLDQSKK